MSIDLRGLHQAAYDYVWDRWGIHVGTVRAAAVFAGFSSGAIASLHKTITGAFHPIEGIVLVLVLLAVIWWLFARKHLGEEWQAQARGDLDRLNAASLARQPYGNFLRAAMLLLLAAISLTFNRNSGYLFLDAIGLVFVVVWTYTTEILVRERDPFRFARTATDAT